MNNWLSLMALVFFFDLSFSSSIVCCKYLSLALPSSGYIILFISSLNKSGCGVLRSGYLFLVKIRGLGNFMLKFLFSSSDSLSPCSFVSSSLYIFVLFSISDSFSMFSTDFISIFSLLTFGSLFSLVSLFSSCLSELSVLFIPRRG
jgi:hypothetical protein